MTSNYESPTFEALVAEQKIVQADKFQGRLLGEYNRYIFTGQSGRESRSCSITDFLKPYCVGDQVSLDGVIRGLCLANAGNTTRWVDMGGGRGLPMRQLATTDTLINRHVSMTNVDLFDYGLDKISPEDTIYLDEHFPGITDKAAAPQFIQANVETVALPEPAHLITSVEVIQYLNNPLAAISNWYNQLADSGFLVISTHHDWSSWIRYKQENPGETPTGHFLGTLEAAGVSFAASRECDQKSGDRPPLDPASFCNLVIQKIPGTMLAVRSPIIDVRVNPYDYKATYYEKPESNTGLIVEVIAAQNPIGVAALNHSTRIDSGSIC